MKNLRAQIVPVLFAILVLDGCSGSAGHGAAISDQAFKQATDAPGVLVVDFWATWCGPCMAMKPVVEQAEKDYAGKIRFLSVDVDENKSLANQFEIQAIPNFIVFKDGKKVDARVGGMNPADFKKWLDGFLTPGK